MLAQIEAVKPLAEGFGSHFLPYALAVACIVIGILAKVIWDLVKGHAAELVKVGDQWKQMEKEHDAAIAALNAQLLAEARAGAAEVRKTLEQVMPLQAQLAEMIRLTDRE